MDPQVVEERLASLYPSWYVPLSHLITGPGGERWDTARPQVYVARYRDELPYDAWCPDQGSSSVLVSKPLPWTAMYEALRAQDWPPTEAGPVSNAYSTQERYAQHIADHLVAPADGQDPRCVVRRLMRGTFRSTVTVIADDGTVWAAVRTRGNRTWDSPRWDAHQRYGVVVQFTTEPGTEPTALLRGLYAPALISWFYWWHGASQQPYTSTLPALAKWTVPWPTQLEITGPDFDRPSRVRLDNITSVHFG